jgi:uncharacterized damage-inducible protein DinB
MHTKMTVPGGNMSYLTIIKTLYLHGYWADDRIFDCASRLDEKMLFERTRMPRQTLFGTMFHAIGAEWLWINRCRGISPSTFLLENETPDLPTLREKWQEQQQITISFLDQLKSSDLRRAIDYRSISGEPRSNILWHILVHVPIHSLQHRAEAAQILTEFGESPGDLDFDEYVEAVDQPDIQT